MFFRFAFMFGGMAFLFLVALGAMLLVVQALNTNWQSVGGLALVVCMIPLAFISLAGWLGRWSFRRVAAPIADLMSAADAVAEGDLTVRLREDVPGEFGKLASRFNNMTAELQRSEQQRRNLTADIAHELRNPLHIIQGNLEGMLDDVYQPTTENLTATLDETRLLARLVTDLQTLSLAESGQLALHPVPSLAADLLADAAANFSARAAEQGIHLSVEMPAEAASLQLNVDPHRIGQVLSNLLVNALRHTPSGGSVTLGASPTPGGVRLTVSDTGVGIPPEDLPYVFDRFWRGDRSRGRAEGTGSGLGLAIAKQLVEAHGGTISATSRLGGGTEMVIDLPATA
jgi:two-component system OmpR family sensor kinase/two-component system sensor histidine kinase BaeS